MSKPEVVVVPLEKTHDVAGFDCGDLALNTWLRNIARHHAKKSLSRIFVLVDDAEPHLILGFYTLNIRKMTALADLPPALAKKLPHQIPGLTIGRLAIALSEQKKGYGEKLLVDAMVRARRASTEVGGSLLCVDAKDEAAAAFYRHFAFEPLPGDPLTLCISLAMIT